MGLGDLFKQVVAGAAGHFDVIEGLGPNNARGFSSMLYGGAGSVSGKPTAAASAHVLASEIKKLQVPVSENVQGLGLEQRERRLKDMGALLPVKSLTKQWGYIPTPSQVIEESERRQQAARSKRLEELLKAQAQTASAEPGPPPLPTSPPVYSPAPVKGSILQRAGRWMSNSFRGLLMGGAMGGASAAAQVSASEIKRLSVPVSEEIKGMNLQQRETRLKEMGSFISAKALTRQWGVPVSGPQAIEESERRQQNAREQRLKELHEASGQTQNGMMQGIMGLAASSPVTAAAGFAGAIVGATKALVAFSESALESNRDFRHFNTMIAGTFARLDYQQRLLDYRYGAAVSGSTRVLGDAVAKRRDSWESIREAGGNAWNLLGAAAATYVTPAETPLDRMKIAAMGPAAMLPLLITAVKDLSAPFNRFVNWITGGNTNTKVPFLGGAQMWAGSQNGEGKEHLSRPRGPWSDAGGGR